MEKTYKRVPFDIELAKKIQAGEIEGRIVTRDGQSVRICCFDALQYNTPILCLLKKENENEEYPLFYVKDGRCGYDKENPLNLVIELPEETPKHEFKPFDKVLVRESDEDYWHPDFFIMWHGQFAECVGIKGGYVIPYEGNEYLVGTIGEPKED